MKRAPTMKSSTGIFIYSKSFEDVLQFKFQRIKKQYINMVRDDICRRKHSDNVSTYFGSRNVAVPSPFQKPENQDIQNNNFVGRAMAQSVFAWFPMQRLVSDTRSCDMGFVVDRMTMGHRVLRISPASSHPTNFSTFFVVV